MAKLRFLRYAICPHTSYLILQSSYFIPHTSYLILQSSYFIPLTSYLILHSSFLLLHSSYFIPHSSFFILHTSYFSPPTSYFIPPISHLLSHITFIAKIKGSESLYSSIRKFLENFFVNSYKSPFISINFIKNVYFALQMISAEDLLLESRKI